MREESFCLFDCCEIASNCPGIPSDSLSRPENRETVLAARFLDSRKKLLFLIVCWQNIYFCGASFPAGNVGMQINSAMNQLIHCAFLIYHNYHHNDCLHSGVHYSLAITAFLQSDSQPRNAVVVNSRRDIMKTSNPQLLINSIGH